MSNLPLGQRKRSKKWLIAIPTAVLAGLLVYQLPFVQDRIGWRVDFLIAEIYYRINPPEERAFLPDPTLVAMVEETLAALTPTVTTSPTEGPTPIPTASLVPSPIPTAIPVSHQLNDLSFEYQKLNNCGPANLSMALSFWGWVGDQRDTAAILKPNVQDKNVMPYEMADFVNEHTGLQAVVRVGGDLDTIKGFIAAGFPVLVEKSYDVLNDDLGWMGHYQVLFEYDDERGRFVGQDSYVGPSQPISYEDLLAAWRGFNYTYLVIYPSDARDQVFNMLGEHADEEANIRLAAQRASDEIFSSSGRDQFFAWFNRGTNLVLLQDYAGAAAAYDEAFALRASLNLPRTADPWRIMWYQTGPYWAYFYTGRYWDVFSLATVTLDESNPKKPQLEESLYWRGLAKEALGDVQGAIQDWQISIEYRPDFEPSAFALQRLGY
jgi:hypothetical protein